MGRKDGAGRHGDFRCRILTGFLCGVALASCVTFPGPQINYGTLVDSRVCSFALTPRTQTLNWENRRKYARDVREAKRRGFSIHRCTELAERLQVANTRAVVSRLGAGTANQGLLLWPRPLSLDR